MIVNPDKFKAVVFTKSKQDTSGIPISLKDHYIASQDTVKLLGITTDYRMSYEEHVSGLCKTVASQLSALKASPIYRPISETSQTGP